MSLHSNIETEKMYMKSKDDNEGDNNKMMNWNIETELINGAQAHCSGVDRFIVHKDMNCNKNRDDLDTEEDKLKFVYLPRFIKGENADENQLKLSPEHVMEGSGVEITIKTEEIEIKSEDADMSSSEDYKCQQNNVQIKSCKKERNEERPIKKEVFCCEICSTWYSTKNRLAIHKVNIHGKGAKTSLYECDQCTFTSRYKGNLTKHGLVHKKLSEATLYKCPNCQYETKYKYNLKLHLLTRCQGSDEHILNTQAANVFIPTGKKNSVPRYTCSLCPYMAVLKSQIRKHQISHKSKSELATFDCFHCPYKAKRKKHLRNHLKIHKSLNELTAYKCNTCGFITKYEAYLKRHLLGHTGELEIELFRCNKCIFQTKYKTNLRNHMLNHMGISQLKKYKCELCPYRTKARYTLNRHSMTHPEIKQASSAIQCEHCSYQSHNKSSFKRHLLHVHNDKTLHELPIFKCFLCSYQTKHKSNLITHVKIHSKSSATQLLQCATCGGEYNKFYVKRHQSTCVGHTDFRSDSCSGGQTNKKTA